MGKTLNKISEDIKQTNDRIEFLEKRSKTLDLERGLDNLVMLELKKFCLRFRTIPEDLLKINEKSLVPALVDLLNWKEEE